MYLFALHSGLDYPQWSSQPEPRRQDSDIGSGSLDQGRNDGAAENLWFSQPVHPDHLLLSQTCTPGSSQVSVML